VPDIHSTAIVDAGAALAAGVRVGAYSIIGGSVEIGPGTTIAEHVVVRGRTRIGADNRIFQFNSIGDAPQDKKYAGEPTELVIGDGNTIREFCTLNTGTVQDQGVTRIGVATGSWRMCMSRTIAWSATTRCWPTA
jgi:UDP-N-acetylglucosamine acyltransferase